MYPNIDDAKHPIQPLGVTADDPVLRFKRNKVIVHLLSSSVFTWNDLIIMGFPAEDLEQLAQLTGYSLSGFAELPYVTTPTYETAHNMSNQGISEDEARLKYLENAVEQLRATLSEVYNLIKKNIPVDLLRL